MSRLSAHFSAPERKGLGVRVIHFQSGNRALDSTRFNNRRSEMWFKFGRRWFASPRCHLPNRPGLKSQLSAPGYHEDTRNVIAIETKEQVRKRTGQPSGNAADAILMAVMAREIPVIETPANSPEAPTLHPALAAHFRRIRAAQDQELIGA
jgi:hypothetical protein